MIYDINIDLVYFSILSAIAGTSLFVNILLVEDNKDLKKENEQLREFNDILK